MIVCRRPLQMAPEQKKNSKVKGEIGELEFYFRKIPMHQQKFLVVSVLSNSLFGEMCCQL